MTNSSSPMPPLASATPHSLLEVLYAQLRPTPIWSTLPSTLNVFAHLQLVAFRIRSEAQRALDDNAALTQVFMDEDVPDQEWIRRGALNRAQGIRLEGWAEEGVEEGRPDEMMQVSLEFRLYHMVLLLTNAKPIPVEQSKKVLNTYFPVVSPADVVRSTYCYIRAMTDAHVHELALYREKVLLMYDELEQAEQYGHARPKLKDLLPSATHDRPQQLVQVILDLAEGVVSDAARFEAMFPEAVDGDSAVSLPESIDPPIPEQSHNGLAQAGPSRIPLSNMQRPIASNGTTSTQAGDPSIPPDRSGAATGSRISSISRQSTRPPRSTSPRTSPPPIRSWPNPTKPPMVPKSLNARRSLGTPSRPLISPKPTSSPTTSTSESSRKPRVSGLPPATGPDYTSPLPSPSQKSPLKPFPNSALVRASQMKKRSRLSETHGPDGGVDDRQEKRVRTGENDT